MCYWQDSPSVEAQAAQNLGDEDWEDLLPVSSEGCTRKATLEVERSFIEPEPVIDKFAVERSRYSV